jgi:small-conductance mechanosensitive channel
MLSPTIIFSIAVVVAGIVVYATITAILRIQERKQDRRMAHAFLHSVRTRLTAPFGLMILLGCFAAILPGVLVVASVQEGFFHGVRIAMIATSTWLLIRALAVGRDMILMQHDMDAEDNLEARRIYTQIRVIERLLAVAVFVMGFSLALMSFDRMRQIGVSLMASAGVLGIIIGFAAQTSIATVLAGLQIAITQPIRLDDVVIVEGEWGRIEEITLTYVVVNIWDRRRLIVPIKYFIENPFQNWTRSSADILGTVFLHTDYRVPVEEVRKKLHEILDASPLWDKQAWCLQVTEARASTLELRALMSARNSPQAWDLRCHVREALLTWLQKKYPEYLPRTRVSLTQEEKSGTATEKA